MSHRRLLAAGIIIVCLILIGFLISVPHVREAHAPTTTEGKPEVVPVVVLHRVFKKGVHTLSGTVLAPNACGQVTASATNDSDNSIADQSGSLGVTLALTLTTPDGICLEVPTPIGFSTTIAAPSDVPIRITVNGKEASTTAS